MASLVLYLDDEATVLKKLKQLGTHVREGKVQSDRSEVGEAVKERSPQRALTEKALQTVNCANLHRHQAAPWNDLTVVKEAQHSDQQQLAKQNKALKKLNASLEQQVEALQIAQENYRKILDDHLNGIYQFTYNDRYIWLNCATSRIFGYDSPSAMMARTEAIGEAFVEPNEYTCFKYLLKKYDEVRNFRYWAQRQDDKQIWVENNTWAVRDRHKNLLYYQSVICDISAQQQKAPQPQQIPSVKIDRSQQAREVAKIVQSDSFQQMKQKLATLKDSL